MSWLICMAWCFAKCFSQSCLGFCISHAGGQKYVRLVCRQRQPAKMTLLTARAAHLSLLTPEPTLSNCSASRLSCMAKIKQNGAIQHSSMAYGRKMASNSVKENDR